MSTAVAQPRAWFGSDNRPSTTFAGHSYQLFANGTALVDKVEVFKSGTFRDSMGEQHTWLPEHLHQMVANFNTLKTRDIFPNVPARRDHSISIDKVMGYVENMSTDGNKLFADIHVTEPSDVDKLVRGTYRARSLEVGMYIDNTEAAYWPTVFGVAYVDVPAVEGLHMKSKETSYFSLVSQGDGNMATQTTDDRPPQTVIHVHGAGTGEAATPPTPPTPPTPTPAPAPTPPPTPTPAPAPTPPTPHAGTFRVNGADTVDFAAVQRHIDTLEGVIKTVNENARKAFVAQLATDKKIVQPQVEGLQAFALSLPPEAYEAWIKTYEGAQVLPLLQSHGGATNSPDAGANKSVEDDHVEVLEAQVAMFKRIMTKERLEETAAFKELAQLKANKS